MAEIEERTSHGETNLLSLLLISQIVKVDIDWSYKFMANSHFASHTIQSIPFQRTVNRVCHWRSLNIKWDHFPSPKCTGKINSYST